jgi:D-erythrulose 1-phosphate 3-epimerase
MIGPQPNGRLPGLRLGINTCFTAKRWPEPERCAEIIVGQLGLRDCQVSLDLADPVRDGKAAFAYAQRLRAACEDAGIRLHSTFTGLSAYMTNGLLHPDQAMRSAAQGWFEACIQLTATMGAPGTGGFLGALSVADAADDQRRRELKTELSDRMQLLAQFAAASGLEFLMMENMAVTREPGHSIPEAHELERVASGSAIPWRLCLDLGHPAALQTPDPSGKPVAWLRESWAQVPVIQLQQANRAGDHHWPFTPSHNARGLVVAADVLSALSEHPNVDPCLILEIIHPHEADDHGVLDDLVTSVAHWREAISEAVKPPAGQ